MIGLGLGDWCGAVLFELSVGVIPWDLSIGSRVVLVFKKKLTY